MQDNPKKSEKLICIVAYFIFIDVEPDFTMKASSKLAGL
jgi:hypothetical protein